MPATHYICRRACPEDIRRSRKVWECSQKYFDAQTWRALPSLLEELMGRDVVTIAILESVHSNMPRPFAGVSFVHPDYIKEALSSSVTLHNFIFAAVLRGEAPFLTPKQVATENARGTLNLMNFLGSWDVSDLSGAELSNFWTVNNEGYRFFHFGYNYKVMWFEVFEPPRAAELLTQGMHISREVPLADGETATLFRLTAEEAQANPYRRFCTLFFPPKPYFQFSSGEQRLLEYALLDYSDEDATKTLHLSPDAVKKRWRSIYQKVDMTHPELLSRAKSGTARRRALLRYLKHHLEELRPYRHL